ncbi:MAG: hypothetical protein ABI315_13655 [Bacteroidia bacterium]
MKKPALFFIFIFTLVFSVAVSAQKKITPAQEKKVDDIFKNKEVVHFKFPVSSMQEIGPLTKIISIDGNKSTMVSAHATKEQFKGFIVKNYPYTIEPSPTPKAKPGAKPKTKSKAKSKAKPKTAAKKTE